MLCFLDTLQRFRHTECEDLRDKVYAPLCLASKDVRQYIQPDYVNKTVLSVYTEVVKYYLTQTGNELDFMGSILYSWEARSVQTPGGIIEVLPSWVPNFATNDHFFPVPKILYVPKRMNSSKGFLGRFGFPTATRRPAFSPLSGHPPVAVIKNQSLFVRGAYIDVLKDKILLRGADPETFRSAMNEKFLKWSRKMNGKYFTGESCVDAFNRTVVFDIIYDDLGRPSKRGCKQDVALIRRLAAELSSKELQHQRNLTRAHHKATLLRDIGLSEKNYYLMVPKSAEEGDEIWALCGGKACYVLRSVNRELRQYLLIWECYAHGLMDGEVVSRLRCGEAKMEAISLV